MLRTLNLVKRAGFTLLLLLIVSAQTGSSPGPMAHSRPETINEEEKPLYEQLELAELGLRKSVFEKAVKGLQKLAKTNRIKRDAVLSIADMSQSANSKRLYVIDLAQKIVLFNTYVSHGRNSGEEFARSFGNKPQSYKSSLGFYATGNCYQGAHGLSLRLQGLETGINHKAEQRGIVIHGADYVSESFIEKYGRLGRSQGCPAVPAGECEPIVNTIKEGTCFFVFYPDSNYFRRSLICSNR